MTNADDPWCGLLPPNIETMGIKTIFYRDITEPGGCFTMPWHISIDALEILLRSFFKIDAGGILYQAVFVMARKPEEYGYRALLAIKPKNGDGAGTTLAKFISVFARGEHWRVKRENNGKNPETVQISITVKNGLILVASIVSDA